MTNDQGRQHESTRRPGGADGNDPTADEEAGMMAAAPEDATYLFAVSGSSLGVNLDGRITLHGASETLYFSDRPYRVTGTMTTEDFVASWGEGDDTFAENPPNALLTLVNGDTIDNIVVILTEPDLSYGDLSFAVTESEGRLRPSSGPASILIDGAGSLQLVGWSRAGTTGAARREPDATIGPSISPVT